MTLKEAMLSAKEIIETLEKKGRVNSQHFGIVYFTLTGNKYVYTNCTTCFADSYKKLKAAYKDILDNKKCSECQPVSATPEPVIEPIPAPTVVNPKRNRKK